MSPTERTLQWCRKQGWEADVAEKWIPQTKRRRDLFGFVDIVALTGEGIVGIQATSTPNVQARVKKIGAEVKDKAVAWLNSGGEIWVMGWKKYKQPVKRRYYRETVIKLSLADLQQTEEN